MMIIRNSIRLLLIMGEKAVSLNGVCVKVSISKGYIAVLKDLNPEGLVWLNGRLREGV